MASLQIGILGPAANGSHNPGPVCDCLQPVIDFLVQQIAASAKVDGYSSGEVVCFLHPKTSIDVALIQRMEQSGVTVRLIIDQPLDSLQRTLHYSFKAEQVFLEIAQEAAVPREKEAGIRQILVGQSDLLLIVTDDPAADPREAVHGALGGEITGTPVVLTPTTGGSKPLLLSTDEAGAVNESGDIYGELGKWLQSSFLPAGKHALPFRIFEPGLTPGGFYPTLLWLVSGMRGKSGSFWIGNYEQLSQSELRFGDVLKRLAPRHAEWLQQIRTDYAPTYVWADRLGLYYGDLFRSAIVAILCLSVFAGSAIMLLLTGQAHHGAWIHHLEQVSLIGVVLLVTLNWRCGWKQKWLDYRLLAELIRPMPYLAAMGRRFHPAETKGRHGLEWNRVAAQYRSSARTAQCRGIVINARYLSDLKQVLLDLVEGQIAWHSSNEDKQRSTYRKLYRAAAFLFLCVLAISICHAFLEQSGWDLWIVYSAAVAATVASAIGALLEYIGFEQVIERSELARTQLVRIKTRMESDRNQPALGQVGSWCTEITSIMADEQLNWYNQMSTISLHLH